MVARSRATVTGGLLLAATTLSVTGTPALAAPSTGERFIATFTGEQIASQNNGTLFAVGPIRGVGTLMIADNSETGADFELVLPHGTVFVSVTGTVDDEFDPRSCVERLKATGTFEITRGDGAFLGATGSGTAEEYGTVVHDRAHCSQMDPASRGLVVIDLRGTVTVPAAAG